MLIPVVISGGAGTRLWPVSREAHPKPFMRLPDGESLILKTFRRALQATGSDTLLTVTNREYYFLSKDEFSHLKPLPGASAPVRQAWLLEPTGRNTAPAIAMAAHWVAQAHGPEARMLVLAADHLIPDQAGFAAAVARADALAAAGHLVTFGIRPTAPETGYGYLEQGAPLSGAAGGWQVAKFVEKPDAVRAAAFLAGGRHFWNSGMFLFQAGQFLDALAKNAPDVASTAKACWSEVGAAVGGSQDMVELPAASFGEMPNISVDYAVMERADRVAMVEGDFGWSDIGSWDAVRSLSEPDADGNRAQGDAVFVGSRNTYVQSEDRLIAAVGVSDLMVIDTPDAVLVAHPDHAQDVKHVVARLKASNHEAYRLHRTVARPWGTYTILGEGTQFKIKRIEVKPGASLSLQMHHHRSEHWIVVSGMARVVNGEQELLVSRNESTYIPAGHRHRLENPGILPLVMIEVQSGEYLGEDDIVRFEDRYGRS